jgi:hypothetical protein
MTHSRGHSAPLAAETVSGDHPDAENSTATLEPIGRTPQVSVIESTTEISPSTSQIGKNQPRNAIACARCDNWWAGMLTSHCGACHHTFTGLTAFEAHRDGSHSQGTRRCLDPIQVGLVRSGRDYLCWGFPSDGSEWWKAKR